MSAGEVIAVGECMVELSQTEGGLYRQGFAGDTFNTAWYLRRLLPAGWGVAYGTCLGDDPMSERMLEFMAAAGVSTTAVRRIPGRSVGLYMIALKDGERSFAYWRDTSAARELASDPGWLAAILAGKRAVHFSGITLAILAPERRRVLLEALAAVRRAGTTVVFDPNMRPRLWPDGDAMRMAVSEAAANADCVLPSFDEESLHFGDASPADTVARYRDAGATTVVVKNGPGALHFWARGEEAGSAAAAAVPRVVDTTAAGDAFNAGFLAARLTGGSLPEAVAAGSRIAAHVIGHYGALVAPPEV